MLKSFSYILMLLFCGCQAQDSLDFKIRSRSGQQKTFSLTTQNQDNLIPFHNEKGEWGYWDAVKDSMAISPKYSRADLFSGGIAKVYRPNPHPKNWEDQSLTGFIDTHGHTIFEPQFTDVYPVRMNGNHSGKDSLSDLRWVYKNDGTGGVISLKSGEWLLNSDGSAEVVFYDRTHFVINENTFYHEGEKTTLPSNLKIDWVYFSPRFLRVKNNAGASGLYSWKGEKILPTNYLDFFIDSVAQRIVASRLRGGTTLGTLRRIVSQNNENAKNIKIDLLDFQGRNLKTFTATYQADEEENGMASFEAHRQLIYFRLSDGKILDHREKVLQKLPNGYEVFQLNEQKGLRTVSGEVLIQPQYRQIVYIDSSHIIAQTPRFRYHLLDVRGTEKWKQSYDQISYIPNFNRFMVSEGNYSGQVDEEGNVIIPLEYSGFSMLSLRQNPPYAVYKNYKNGIIDGNGGVLVPFEYDDIDEIQWADSTKTFFRMAQNGKMGLMDQNAQWILPMEYGFISKSPKDEGDWLYLEAYPRNTGKYGLYNVETALLIEPQYKSVDVYPDFIMVSRQKENTTYYQLLDKSGNPLTDADYTNMEWTKGYLLCAKHRKYGVLDKNGKTLIPFDYEYIWAQTPHLIYVQDENDDYFYMDISGKSYKNPK